MSVWHNAAIRRVCRHARRATEAMKAEVRRVFDATFKVYGVRKVWRQMQREGFDIARCSMERLMRDLGLQGVIRGKLVKAMESARPRPVRSIRSTASSMDRHRACCGSRASPTSRRWPGSSISPFVIDVYARYIVGWRVSRTAHSSFVPDTPDQAIHDRRPAHCGGFIHHRDRGSQYVLIKYTERLAKVGIEP